MGPTQDSFVILTGLQATQPPPAEIQLHGKAASSELQHQAAPTWHQSYLSSSDGAICGVIKVFLLS